MKTTLTLLTDLGVLLGTTAATGTPLHSGSDGPRDADPELLVSTSCTKVVHCKNGDTFTNANFQTEKGTTCEAECDGHCCVGVAACNYGKFSVCADEGDGSCSGMQACYKAGLYSYAIGLISGGSCRGDYACSFLFGHCNAITKRGLYVTSSCIGYYACDRLGGCNEITNICSGDYSCQRFQHLPNTCKIWLNDGRTCGAPRGPSSTSPSMSPSVGKSALPSGTPSGFPKSSKSKPGKNSKSKTGKAVQA